jgi:ATP-binding cassette subfamily C protein LapB
MRDAKTLFDDLKRRLDPLGRRSNFAAPAEPPAQAETGPEPANSPAAFGPEDAGESGREREAVGVEIPTADIVSPGEPAPPATESPRGDQEIQDLPAEVPEPSADAPAGSQAVSVADAAETALDAAAAPPQAVAVDSDALEPAIAIPVEAPVSASTDHGEPPRVALVEEAMQELKAARQLQPPSILPEEAFDAMAREIESLVAEIETRAPQAPVAPAVKPEAALKPGNLLADVRAVAAGWFRNGRKRDAVHAGPSDIATPEELTAAGAERGVDVSYAEKPIKSLEQKDFPCIALDKDGGSHILLGRPDSKTFLAQVDGQARLVARKAIEAVSAGVVFFVKPRPPNEIERPGTRRESEPRPQGVFAIMGSVAAEMFATQRGLLGQLALATIVSNLFTLALPLFSMAVYDRVVPHLAWETLWALSIGVVIILATDFALRYIRLKLLDAVGLSISTSLQARLYSRIVHGRMKDAPSASGGLTSGFREVEGLCHIVPALAVAIAVDIPFFILACFLIYSIGGLVAVTPLIGAFALAMVHVIGHLGEDAARKYSRFTGTQSNVLVETIGALEMVKVNGAERMLLRRWERLVDAASHASHLNRLQGSFSSQASIVISQAVTVLALVIGVYEISTGAMTVGALTACTLLIGRLMTPVSQIMSLLHRTHQLASSAQMMQRVLSTPLETAGDSSEVREEAPIRGDVVFTGVNFAYPGEQTPSLSGLSFTVRPGEKIGLIGRVGSGKSTLLRLLLRIHDATGGTILLDGQDIRQVSPRALRRHFGFMRQDSVLFDDTLQANLCFGLDALRPADLERAVAISGVKDFASRHPQGYGMRVGPRGERLSGGERQSVAMARLLAENPACLLLDEPTAAMDNALEAKIVRDLRDFSKDKTLIIATHRAPLLSLVDRIIWMEGGRIAADGPKDEVMRKLTQVAS